LKAELKEQKQQLDEEKSQRNIAEILVVKQQAKISELDEQLEVYSHQLTQLIGKALLSQKK